ncbi:DUF4268 domain-containing protein [[Clostridium] innocuum]|nr:DUF4268 domain-containing protein [[Clostridium] innocuum]
MNGIGTRLISYMEGSRKRFVIPVYQRNYDWKIENCKQLFDDLVKVVKNNRKSHFFGSIVSVHDGYGEEYLVIDGQQRLTTISLLFLAMHNLLVNGILFSDDSSLSRRILEDYLVDKYEQSEKRIKLKPVKNDKQAFGKLFNDETDYIVGSNLTINYGYFYERIKKQEITIDELYDSICKLEIIDISLNQEDNPQLIFESLNSTGLALSEGDKIRNLILMGLPTKLQNEYYEKYWNKIEECTNYDVSLFVRDYLSIKQQATPTMNRIYFTFKNYVEENNWDIEELLINLLAYAKLYQILLKGNIDDRSLRECIYRLNRLETTVTRPFFLEVLRLNSKGIIDSKDLSEIFLITESYLFRRTICDLPTNMLNKIFMLLHKEIIRYDGTADNYLDKLKYAFISKRERARFPDDEEFSNAFVTKQIYLMNSKNKMYLFERIENFGTSEDKAVWNHFDQGDYSIEHIMPQHLTPSWINSLGDDYEMIHETWLHRIANLTITAYNSKYSNNTFEEKKNMKNGFLDSGIRINQRIAQKSQWGLSELEERSDYMGQKALDIWKLPKTTFKPKEKQLENFTLDDDVDFSGRKIARFSFKNVEQPVKSWTDMYEKVLRMLHSENKSVLVRLANTEFKEGTADLNLHVSSNPEVFTIYAQIDTNIYVWTNTNTQYKISLLQKFFKLYNVDPSDLIFYLKDDTIDCEEGSINELRKKYWTFALEKIHEAHGGGSFSNVHTTTSHWVSGFVGLNGVNITCAVNNNSIRVEFRMENFNKSINKQRYDILVHNKKEIELKLGTDLIWVRGDDIKLSKVYVQLEQVNLSNEEDWENMAQFHANWSKMFYDTLVPYLESVGV